MVNTLMTFGNEWGWWWLPSMVHACHVELRVVLEIESAPLSLSLSPILDWASTGTLSDLVIRNIDEVLIWLSLHFCHVVGENSCCMMVVERQIPGGAALPTKGSLPTHASTCEVSGTYQSLLSTPSAGTFEHQRSRTSLANAICYVASHND